MSHPMIQLLGALAWGVTCVYTLRRSVVELRHNRAEVKRLHELARAKDADIRSLNFELQQKTRLLKAQTRQAEEALGIVRFHRHGIKARPLAETQAELKKDLDAQQSTWLLSQRYADMQRAAEKVELWMLGKPEPTYIDGGPVHEQDGFAEGETPAFLAPEDGFEIHLPFADGGPLAVEGTDETPYALPGVHSPWCPRGSEEDLDRWNLQDDWPKPSEGCTHPSHESRSA